MPLRSHCHVAVAMDEAALGGHEHLRGVARVGGERGRRSTARCAPGPSASSVYASAVSMKVIPASSAAWIVATARAWSGRPSIDSGIPPSPIALTVVSPMRRNLIPPA